MLGKVTKIIGFTLAIGFIISCMIGIYTLKRSVNYSLSYESMVEKTSESVVCSMIKPERWSEVLSDPSKCR